MELYVCIMAGGVGSRFWPRSKQRTPKQLLKIFSNNSMIYDTVERLNGLVDNEKIYVVTNKVQKDKIEEELPFIPKENIIAEPYGKNTAACIGLASVIIEKKSKDAVVLTLPADHLIKNGVEFRQILIEAAEFAYNKKGLVTIGINPTRPETGYGYIQINEEIVEKNIHKVLTFAEKPNLATAERFLESGDFMWNSGMFIWRVDTILKEFKMYMGELYTGLQEIASVLDTDDYDTVLPQIYSKLKSVSIDYGIMEKANNVYVLCSDFGWSDFGTWNSLYENSPKDIQGNVVSSDNVILYTTNNCIINMPKDKLVVIQGLSDYIVVESEGTLMICKREDEPQIRQFVNDVRLNKGNQYV